MIHVGRVEEGATSPQLDETPQSAGADAQEDEAQEAKS